MKIGLFFGSFNPIHVGHLIVANTMATATDLEQVWFVVSPQNPFKKTKSLLHEFDRYDMVERAIADNSRLKATNIEFSMPRPSYTIDTLIRLQEKYPQHQFKLIIGEVQSPSNLPTGKTTIRFWNTLAFMFMSDPDRPRVALNSIPAFNW